MKAEAVEPVAEDRSRGKHILTLMTYLPVEDIKAVWKGMSPEHRLKYFGHGHAEELDTLIKHLGTVGKADHLDGDSEGFEGALKRLHLTGGMGDHRAARVLHTASGVRMAHRALLGPGKTGGGGTGAGAGTGAGQAAHETTMAILNARYREKD